MDRTKPTLRQSRNVSADTGVDALFMRLAARYGSLWLERWANIPMPIVKAEWATALDPFHPVQIRQAIEFCGTFPPTLPEFVSHCRSAPKPFVAPIEDLEARHRTAGPPVPMPEKVKAQIANILHRKTNADA